MFLYKRSVILLVILAGRALAQPEVMAWGNLTGVRVEGHLLELNTSICVAPPKLEGVSCTGREKQQNSYSRNGKFQTVTVHMSAPREFRDTESNGWRMAATEVVEDTGPGTARVNLQFMSPDDANIGGVFLGMDLPAAVFSGGSAELIGPAPPAVNHVSLAAGPAVQNEYVRATAKGLRFLSQARQIEVTFSEPTEIIVRDDRSKGSYDLQVLLAVIAGKTSAGQSGKKTFAFKVTGEIDRNPVHITVDPTRPGQMFDGLGGNFRLQNTRTDPQVIDYTLQNMRIAWGRVEIPWDAWQPDEATDSLAAARAGTISPRVRQAMEMARRLSQKGMPVIVSAWRAPGWAILGAHPLNAAAPAGEWPVVQEGPRGNPLNPEKMARIEESIAGYLLFLKEKYGVEAALFSFNESDLGIDVRQTPGEHAELIKTLGAYFAGKGLATKLALGDTSDATPIDFIKPAMHDPEAVPYIGAVDFHSWRGCTDDVLTQWRDAARELNVPLIVAEGSTDAAAYRYPQIFNEASFALYEINLYLRILSIAQPKSILQWQLTADYSLLAGGGIYNDDGALRPTRRFWNLKQLASTPPRSFALPVTCDQQPNLTCAAFGNIAEGSYAVHIVNNGASRNATLTGLPPAIRQLRLWVTDAQHDMQESQPVPVSDGRAQFSLAATSYTTLIGNTQ